MKKTILITGAGGNLGKAVTRKFLDEGYDVEATARGQAEIDALTALGNVRVNEVNLLDEEESNQFIAALRERHEKIDAAVLLVGGFSMGDMAQCDGASLRKMYALNFESAYFICRPLLSWMKTTGPGRIVLTGARPALEPKAAKGLVAYSLSKSLIFRLAEIINEEGKKENVVAAVVVPSIIDTPPNRAAMPDADFSKWVTPESIAENIAFICSEKARDQREPIIKMYGGS